MSQNAVFKVDCQWTVSSLSEVLMKVEVMFTRLCFSAVMQLNNQLLNVNSTPQEVVGVMLSKNETGVTATFNVTSVKAHLFFDGYTAQLQLKGNVITIFASAVT